MPECYDPYCLSRDEGCTCVPLPMSVRAVTFAHRLTLVADDGPDDTDKSWTPYVAGCGAGHMTEGDADKITGRARELIVAELKGFAKAWLEEVSERTVELENHWAVSVIIEESIKKMEQGK